MRYLRNIKISLSVLITGAVIIAYSCKKVKVYANTNGGAAFINAVPDTTFDAADTGFLVMIDTAFRTNPVPYLGSTTYLITAPGTWAVQLRSSIDSVKTFYLANSEVFESNQASSYFIYDTLKVGDSILNVVKLNDDLTPPPTGIVLFRFLNLAVASGPVDVTFARSAPMSDSITIPAQAYIGDTPDAIALSIFNRNIPLGSYNISLKEPGTQTILASGPIELDDEGIYTFYATGLAAGLPLRIGVYRHFP